MSFAKLKQEVWFANMELADSGLVVLTWGNVSGVDREAGVMAIKPSGVDYDALTPEDIVILSIDSGEKIAGDLRPSSDTPSHLILYQEFDSIGGVVHTHSAYATSWAQACREIPCLGTTHADYFYGSVPLTRQLTPEEIKEAYERNTGAVIVERFVESNLDPGQFPGVLLPNHGVFTWGKDPMSALESSIVVEEVAKMGFHTMLLNPEAEIPQALLDKHFLRKHGPGAYYGQKK
ncbi:L-ribulose-5-phosphate 4-epimerase AraD [Candidatus Poribacteria bacterium]